MKLLDCTLRDGGYYTNWDFDQQLAKTYFKAFNDLPVEYLEIGYRSPKLAGYLGEYFYCPLHVLQRIREQSNKKLVVILNEKDVRAHQISELLEPCKPYLDMIRLAVDPENFERALKLGRAIKKLGFELGFNVMYMSSWEDYPALMDNMSQLDGLADYLYMVDSFGGVYPADVIRTIENIRKRTSVPLGFHGHNNLELGLINTLTALEHGVEIVDATITGMGRGAGNLKMELLLTVLNARNEVSFDYNALAKVTDGFMQLQRQHEWGTNLPYMVSGAYSLPQKQVMEWVGKRFYSFNSILRALANRARGLEDNESLRTLEIADTAISSTAVIVGGGPSIQANEEAIQTFLNQNKEFALIHASATNALIFRSLENSQYFCLVGNEGHRLEDVFAGETNIKGKCILPPYPRTMGTYIPKVMADMAYELPGVNFTDRYRDSHTAIALQTALNLKASKILILGYDGYSGATISQREQELFLENEYLFSCAKKSGIECISLTTTKYQEPIQGSVFAEL